MTALLPPNSTLLETAAQDLLAARFAALPVDLPALWSAQDCPEELLPWLAWALSIDQWDAAWPLLVRRARIATAIAVQRRKGTASSVQDVITSFGGQVALREWFEKTPPGVPHTFDLLVSLGGIGGAPPTVDYIDAVIAEVTRTKPARSHFTFTLAVGASARIGTLAAAQALSLSRLSFVTDLDATPVNGLTLGGYALTLGGDYLTVGV